MSVATVDPGPRPAVLGDNLPAAMKAREAHAAHINDLYLEAKNWLDGEKIETQGQHDDLERLLDMVKDAEDAANASRLSEKAPWDEKIADIQDFYNPLISDTKGVQGLTTKIKKAALSALTVWRNKVDAERRAEAARLAKEAEDKARAAADAIRSANVSSDLQAREDAEELLIDAKRTATAATQATAGATGLRSKWVPTLTDASAALKHYITVRPDDLKAVLQRFAEEDVRRSIHTIPGFRVEQVKTAF